ncbi:MAG: MCE family protein [Gammaproteobacteria bacterium]|nr:MCE family protein [Gammaproteobacteria bacterium]
METRASYVVIGAFALAVIVGAVLFVLWLGKLSLDREWSYYNVVFNEPVTGLSLGSAVQYNGIQVGEVRGLSLAPEDPRRAVAYVRLTAGTPVRTDTRARLAFTGLTGVAIIQLTGGSPDAPALAAKPGDSVPEIVASESALQSLLASGGDIVGNANELLLRLAVLLQEDNIAAFTATLRNVETLTAGLADRTTDISRAIGDITAASRALNQSLQRTEPLLANLDAAAAGAARLFDDEGPALLASTRASLDALQQATARIAATVEANQEGLDSFARDGLTQVAPALTELRASVRSLRRLVERLEQDPGALLQPGSVPREYEAR